MMIVNTMDNFTQVLAKMNKIIFFSKLTCLRKVNKINVFKIGSNTKLVNQLNYWFNRLNHFKKLVDSNIYYYWLVDLNNDSSEFSSLNLKTKQK